MEEKDASEGTNEAKNEAGDGETQASVLSLDLPEPAATVHRLAPGLNFCSTPLALPARIFSLSQL